MSRRIVYVSRLTRLPLVGADGAEIGHVVDVVIGLGGRPPRVNGFVVAVRAAGVFIGIGRVAEIEIDGVRLRRGAVNLRQFELRPGERLAVGELVRQRVRGRKRPRRRDHAGARAVHLGGGDDRARRPARAGPAPTAGDHRLERGGRAVRRRAAGRPRGGDDRRAAPGRDGRGDPPAAAQSPPRPRRRARGRPARGPARGAVRGRAGADRRGPRPRHGGARARRDGGRRRGRPARRVLRRRGGPSCSERWIPRRPSLSAGCSPTSPTPPAA